MTNITNVELTQIKERAEKADDYVVDVKGVGGYAVMTVEDTQLIAQFIAHAREDVPRLVAEVERLQHEVGEHSAHNGHLIAAEIIPLSRENKRLRAEIERLNRRLALIEEEMHTQFWTETNGCYVVAPEYSAIRDTVQEVTMIACGAPITGEEETE